MDTICAIIDGNEAAAKIAYKTNEICAIYPITPSSPMSEWADVWSSEGVENIWGNVPRIIEMQSEGGVAGAIHGALSGGVLTTTFTSSQGLLLMIPDMYKIAGELTPCVFHIAARTLAGHALSIFGDHSDVMAVRSTGFGMLFGSNVQEALDMALIAQSVSLHSRVPFMNIFDGFRTSHELMKVKLIPDEVIRTMIDEEDVLAHRNRCLSPDRPVIKGTAQNPDVFFQNKEASNVFYNNLPQLVQSTMNKFYSLTGRKYSLFDYSGHPQAEKIIIIIGSGAETVEETITYLNPMGEKYGCIKVRLFHPFSVKDFIRSIPASVKSIAVLDRTKEPGSIGEPLYQNVITALAEGYAEGIVNMIEYPMIIGGRYGLSSKEFTPAMVKRVFDELKKENPKNHFTIGINDDVTFTSLDYDMDFSLEEQHDFRGLFYGLGSDGTVGANKNSIKIIGETTDYFVQGYFVYDSKKAGALTVSHLRLSKNPIKSTYLISSANFVACHQFNFLKKFDVLKNIKQGGTFLLNSPYSSELVWERLPMNVQKQIIGKRLKFYVINASKVAHETGMGKRTNGILQTCFFAISGLLPREEAISKIKKAIEKTYSQKGESVIRKNFEAVDSALEHLYEVNYPEEITAQKEQPFSINGDSTQFVREILGKIISGHGDELPVSAFPPDGTYPSGTTKYEKRNIADYVPVWDESLCTQCNKCVVICPHAAIRAKIVDREFLKNAPESFKTISPVGKEFDKEKEAYSLQVSVEDCTGCNLCVEYCPVESKTEAGHKAINMVSRLSVLEKEKINWSYFLKIPEADRTRMNLTSVKGTQFLQPLFEFSSACPGCGETPYLKLLTQIFGDRMIVANATGCSSIYGGNLPTTPWSKNNAGRGPAWANSLFEDNAEFGLGIRLALNQKKEMTFNLMLKLKEQIGNELVDAISHTDENTEAGIQLQRKNIEELKRICEQINLPEAKQLIDLADNLSKKSIWLIGGDGWAYDIGFGGLDHILASGEKLNILVLDTEVYSNTGGQTSKATPIGATARFSVAGKKSAKKNLGLMAINYRDVYVAQIALGANDTQTVRALTEAENYPGTSLVVAYSHCIAHGYDLSKGAEQQQKAVKSGYWPLYRYNPLKPTGEKFTFDSKEASILLKDYIYNEARYTTLLKQNPVLAGELLTLAEKDIQNKWQQLNILKEL
jgi:pyruvate-ferredoxin/flavodoxin oxidoreductase